ncbi:hypothetical protein R1flu_001866 [Riccia fluitans]|uniref:Transposase n=1 Tax=Riccia fluitans TaxID=41844 RepID=A0ABD1Y4W6_9MARC
MSHSPNLDKLDQEASMQNIDRLVDALEMEAKESRMSKRRKLFSDEASSSALKVYQPPDREEASTSTVQTGRKYKKDVWQDIAPWFGFSLTHSQPRSKGWVMDDFKKYSLEGHPDGYALDKQTIVQTSICGFPLRSEVAWVTGAKTSFREASSVKDGRPSTEWDSEKGELIREREALKEELNKAKEMAAEAKEMAVEAEQCTEAVRLKKEALQQ